MAENRYIFLSCSEFEPEERAAVFRVLRELGCEIRCDEQAGGKVHSWRSEVLDMIEGCSLFFAVCHEDRPDTVTQKLASEFASALKKPKVIVYLYERSLRPTDSRCIYIRQQKLNSRHFPPGCIQ